jgi:acylphosphatase
VKTRAHVFVSGYVQGVFFRETAKRRADDLNVTGWIRNRDDGRVEAVFEGEDPDVKTLVEWCRRGPPRATVTSVEVDCEKYVGEFDSFEILFG